MNPNPIILEFLRKLATNNNKEWYHANKPLYQSAKLAFEEYVQYVIDEISVFDKSLKGLKPKECTFRIFRDVRFSKDKTPYKVNFGAYMVEGGRKSAKSGYYMHIEPDNSFLAGGAYSPQPDVLLRLRTEIYNNPKKFKEQINRKAFKKYFHEIYGEKLKTAPRGFNKNFEDIDLLRFKSYAFVHMIDDELLSGKDFTDYSLRCFNELKPMNDYINLVIC